MPIYEYRCPACHHRGSRLQKMSDPTVPACPRCRAPMAKQVSRAALLVGDEARAERMSDPSAWGDFDESDPRSMAKALRRMGAEMGEDLDDDFREAVERLEAGEDPDAVEQGMGGGPPSDGWLE